MREHSRRVKRYSPVLALLGCMLAVCGCGVASTYLGAPSATGTTAAATPSPPAQAPASPAPVAFTCAMGSLPVGAPFTQMNCTISSQGAQRVVTGKYTTTSGGLGVDEPALLQAGWTAVEQKHGDGPASSGYDLYFNQNAWFAWHWVARSDNTGEVDIETGMPAQAALISCGRVLGPGSAQQNGFPLPDGTIVTDPDALLIVPACSADVQRYFKTTMQAQGWTVSDPFTPPGYGAGYSGPEVSQMTFTRGSASANIRCTGHPGESTAVQFVAQ
jgi:hypothetical protein